LHQLECMPLAARHPLPAPALSSRLDYRQLRHHEPSLNRIGPKARLPAHLGEFAARRSFHLRSHNTLPTSGRCTDLHPTPRLRTSQGCTTYSLESMAKNFVDLCRHGFTVLQGLNAGGTSRTCLLSCRSRWVVDERRLSNPSSARRRNAPYGYRLPAARHRHCSKKTYVSYKKLPCAAGQLHRAYQPDDRFLFVIEHRGFQILAA
jgi:hypothetical protein